MSLAISGPVNKSCSSARRGPLAELVERLLPLIGRRYVQSHHSPNGEVDSARSEGAISDTQFEAADRSLCSPLVFKSLRQVKSLKETIMLKMPRNLKTFSSIFSNTPAGRKRRRLGLLSKPWQKVKAESEANGKLVDHIDHSFIDPTSFSALK